MQDYISRTLNAYNAHPEQYEQATAGMTPTPEFDDFITLLPDNKLPVLDAGCGFGRDTAKFAERGFKTIGVDMSDGLLKRARELHPSIEFHKMDVRKLDFNDASIGGIWCNATLLHLKDEDTQKALREFGRVLTPGGVVFFSLKEGTGEEEIVEKFSSNGVRYYRYQTIGQTQQLVEGSGLSVIKIYTVNEREKWGQDKRDLNWVYCFAKKPESNKSSDIAFVETVQIMASTPPVSSQELKKRAK